MRSEPYTPTEEELAKNVTIRDRRVVALTRDERLRGLARVKADALREAADDISRYGSADSLVWYNVGTDEEDYAETGEYMRMVAARIEQEARDERGA